MTRRLADVRYEFECHHCGYEFERVIRSNRLSEEAECPVCENVVRGWDHVRILAWKS